MRNVRLVACLLLLLAAPAGGQDAPPALDPSEARLLDELIALVGPPPQAETLVRAMVPEHGFQGRRTRASVGWLVGEGAAAEVVFVGGVTAPAPDPTAYQVVDLVAEATAFYAQAAPAPALDPITVGFPSQRPLVHAVWLRARGRDDLAARALAFLRQTPDWTMERAPQALRVELGAQAGSRVREAFLERADAYAWQVATWMRAHDLRAGGSVGAITRRLSALAEVDRLGQPLERPADWSGWSEAQRLTWTLDEALPEVRARDGSVMQLLDDPRVVEVLRQGDRAVPALIERVADDDRVTRWAPRAQPNLGLLQVRHVALVLAWELIGVRVAARGVEPARRFPELRGPAQEAAALAAFWERYGARPRIERLVALVAEAGAEQAAAAAWELAELGPQAVVGGRRLNPAAAAAQPAVAEALLAAAQGRDQGQVFLEALVALGDARIGPALAAAARDAGGVAGWRFSAAAAALGQPGPLLERWGRIEAADAAAQVTEPARDAALDAACRTGVFGLGLLKRVATPGHPWHAWAQRRLFTTRRVAMRDAMDAPDAWRAHPWALTLVEPWLSSSAPTGGHWALDRGLARRHGGLSQDVRRPAALGGPLAASADERERDVAGRWLADYVLGAPPVHALREDNAALLARARTFLQRFRFRRLTEAETIALRRPQQHLIPDLGVLDGPATADDVAAGRALFHRPESVGPHWVPLPAVALHLPSKRLVLVVQGELDADGAVTWGILGGPNGLDVVGGDGLDGEPIPAVELAARR